MSDSIEKSAATIVSKIKVWVGHAITLSLFAIVVCAVVSQAFGIDVPSLRPMSQSRLPISAVLGGYSVSLAKL